MVENENHFDEILSGKRQEDKWLEESFEILNEVDDSICNLSMVIQPQDVFEQIESKEANI